VLLSTLSPCYAEVKREDIVSYNLDYYNVKVHADKEKAQKEKEQLTVKEAKMEVQKKQETENREARTEKIKKFLTAVVKNIHYSVALEQVYNDNIYLTHTNRVSGFITHPNVDLSYHPKEGMNWKGGHTTFSLDASGGPGLRTSTTSNMDVGRVGGMPTFITKSILANKRGKYTVSGSYGYERHFSALSDIITSNYLAANRPDLGSLPNSNILEGAENLNKAVYYWRKPYGAKLSADWNRIPVEFEYSHTADYYPSDYTASNVESDKFTLTNYFNAFSKTQFLFSYEYERDKYPRRNDGDSTTSTYWTGVKGKLSPKLRGLAQVGYSVRCPEVVSREEITSVKINLDYSLSRALTVNLAVNRQYDVTPYGNQTYVKTLGTQLTFLYQPYFNKKLSFGTGGGLTQYNYSLDRSDSLYDYRLYSQYAWRKWLKFVAEYDYAYRMSDIDVYEYKNNIISMKLVSEF
jgi:hypothetical protein